MVGNAVPPRLAKHLALAIHEQLYQASELSKETVKRSESHSILVGYYRNDKQLKLTKENKIYYVRTGFRPGAMQIPPGAGSPEFLLLHKSTHLELFRLDRKNPAVMYRFELEKMGFVPHGDVYLVFRIEENLDINRLSLNEVIIKRVKSSTTPFIINWQF